MLSRKSGSQELEPPPIAKSHSEAVEVLRVWAIPGQPQQLTLKTTWQDPAAWGLMLADIARHAAKAYGNEGADEVEVLERIRQFLDAEFSERPTHRNSCPNATSKKPPRRRVGAFDIMPAIT
jgi:hypothetical protein